MMGREIIHPFLFFPAIRVLLLLVSKTVILGTLFQYFLKPVAE